MKKFIRFSRAGLGMALLAASIAAPAATAYTVDAARSKLGFTATQSGGDFAGRFKNFRADIVFSDNDLANSRFDVVIDMKSVDTGDDQRDEALRDEDLFAVDKFPTARFVATAFTRKGSGQYEAAGKLTIRDVTRGLRLPFTFESKSPAESWLKGGVTLKRLNYGVGQGEWKDTSEVADDVKVNFVLRLLPGGKKTIPRTPPADSAK